EIDFAESLGFLETVNNSTGDVAVSQKLVIQPGIVNEQFSYPLFNLELTNINRFYGGSDSRTLYLRNDNGDNVLYNNLKRSTELKRNYDLDTSHAKLVDVISNPTNSNTTQTQNLSVNPTDPDS